MIISRLKGFFHKTLEKGLLWSLWRVRNELRRPSSNATRRLMTSIKIAKRWIFSFSSKGNESDDDYLTAVYDLNAYPTTFDFVYFLVAAELFANKHGKNSFAVLIVQRKSVLEDEIYKAVIDEHNVQWRFENIILQMISLYPVCIGYSVLPKTSNVSEEIKGRLVYPEFYDGTYTPANFYREVYLSKNKFTGLFAPVQGIKQINLWKDANGITSNIVTITLRQSDYDKVRNSNIDEWVKFAQLIKGEGFTPVFVPDTDICFERDQRLDGFIVFRDPCWNMGLRMALYEEAYLNYFVPNGPSVIAIFNKKVKGICMKYAVPGSLQSTNKVFKERGLRIGQRKYDFPEASQVLSWETDNFENICDEFYKFLAAYPKSSKSIL
jgi:hypothetical protein